MKEEEVILKSTWKDLTTRLDSFIDNGEKVDTDLFLKENGVEDADLIYSGLTPDKFRRGVAYSYCASGEYAKVTGFIRKISQYDGGSLKSDFSARKQMWLREKDPACLEKLQQSNEWKAFEKEKIVDGGSLDPLNPADVAQCPFVYLEKKELGIKEIKCYFTGKKLYKGDTVYFGNWRRSRVLENEYFSEESFGLYPILKENRDKYLNNTYKLEDFLHINFENPWMNQLISTGNVSFKTILDLVVNGYSAPSSCEWVDPYLWVRSDERDQSGGYMYEGYSVEYLFLLWVLLKCGYENQLIEAINDYPLYYALTLLIFDHPTLGDKVEKKLQIAELKATFGLVKKISLNLKDIMIIADFGKQHPGILDALSVSLHRYEYHLYAMFNHTPFIGCLDWTDWLRGKRGSGMYYFFVYHPEKLPVLKSCLERKQLPSGLSGFAGVGYHNCESAYATVLYHLALTHGADYQYWRDGTQIWRYIKGEKDKEKIVKVADSLLS